MKPTLIELGKRAQAADDRYRLELERVYGPREACNARYKRVHSDPACQAAGEAKLAADAVYWEAFDAVYQGTGVTWLSHLSEQLTALTKDHVVCTKCHHQGFCKCVCP